MDYAVEGYDDLALETWSVVPDERNEGKVGWTRDSTKRTDYTLWFWQDTGRFFLVAFPPLCAVFWRYWTLWRDHYQTERQSSGDWQSECVFVPRPVVVAKLNGWRQGHLPEPEPAEPRRIEPVDTTGPRQGVLFEGG